MSLRNLQDLSDLILQDVIYESLKASKAVTKANVFLTIKNSRVQASVDIPDSTAMVRKKFKPIETPITLLVGADQTYNTVWNKVSKDSIIATKNEEGKSKFKERQLYEPFLLVLQTILESLSSTCKVWKTTSCNNKGKEFIPDLVIHTGDSYESLETDSDKVVIDVEMKRRCKPPTKQSGFLTPNDKDNPGNIIEGYQQLLKRSKKAFTCTKSGKTEYYGVITDMEMILFFVIKNTKPIYQIDYDGPYPFGWRYDQNLTILSFTQSQEVPLGIKKLISFISEKIKANGFPSLQICNDHNHSEQYQIKRILGRGRRSIVFASTNENGIDVCVKLEPTAESEQIKNEETMLKHLNDCKGVPKLLFSGKTSYLGNEYLAIVTDVIGEYSLRDLSTQTDLKLVDITQKCLEILKGIHRKGIVHRDLKPQHIVFSNDIPYIIDFGAAGIPYTYTSFETPEFSPALSDYAPYGYDNDFETLWFCVLSLRQQLPWKETLANSYDTMNLKIDHGPSSMKDVYPLLTMPFLCQPAKQVNSGTNSSKKRKHDPTQSANRENKFRKLAKS